MLAIVDEAIGSVLAGIAVTSLVGLGAFVWRALRTLRRVDEHVLPHFIPPTPDEIRAGAPDHTLPHRVEQLADGASVVRDDLARHMADEAARLAQLDAEHQADVADRAERQASLDVRLDAGDDRMGRIEGRLDTIEDKLDQAISGLAAGNPEIRS